MDEKMNQKDFGMKMTNLTFANHLIHDNLTRTHIYTWKYIE
jgi:hypothetical protein